jgi:DNA adenine methylase
MYVEPFFGGGAILFAKGIPNTNSPCSYHEVINDKDERLINFYRMFQGDNFRKLYRKILYTLHSEAEHLLAKKITRGEIEADDVTKAWAYYVNIQQSFSNVLNSGWTRTRGTPAKNQGATWNSRKQNLLALHQRFSEITISCTDALQVIDQRDHANTFFYLDPPYPKSKQGHYGGYTVQDLQSLVDVLSTIKGKFLLSNYNQPEIEFPAQWKKFEIVTICTSAAAGLGERKETRTEVLWANYSIPSPHKTSNRILE